MPDPRDLRVVFLGNDAWSVPSLDALAASRHPVALVLTRVPKPAGRGSRLTRTPVAEAADRRGLRLLEVETVREGVGFDALRDASPDVVAVVAYGEILPPVVLTIPRLGAVNVHFSLLPALRGASPVQGALLGGLDVTGVTTMLMNEGLDTGPILRQSEEPIRPSDDAGSLGSRLARVGGGLLVETLDGLAAGELRPAPQLETLASTTPRLGPQDREIRWERGAEAVVRAVRAFAPEPGARASFRGDVLKVLRAEALPGSGDPGVFIHVDKSGPVVGAGTGSVRLLEVAPAGRKRMSGPEFVRGFRPAPGERLT